MKRLKIFQLTIVVLFIIFIFFFFKAVNYTKEYTVNNVKVKESYDKENKNYYFTFSYNDVTFDYLINSKYKRNRTFITKIDIIEDESDFCLIPSGNTFDFVPLCVEDNKITYYSSASSPLKEKIPQKYLNIKKELNDTYNNIEIYNRDYTYLLWNYNSFYYINDTKELELKLFEKEVYNLNLAQYTLDYLVVASYDTEYTYDKIYSISFNNGDVKEYKLDYDLYFDSYFLGYQKNKLYMVDNKEELMYELDLKDGSIDKIKPILIEEGKKTNVGIKTLINKDKKFTYQTNYNYKLKDNNLILNYKNKNIEMLIDNNVTSIIRAKDESVFYLKEDTLYVFNQSNGITKLLKNFEWNFNSENMIYVN